MRTEDLRLILDDVGRLPFLRQEIRPTAIQAEQWAKVAPESAISVECCSHIIDLNGDFAAVWKDKFNGQARRGVRKAEKAGLEVEHGQASDMLKPYCGLLERSVERWAKDRGEPVILARWRARRTNSFKTLQRNFETMGDACRMWLAYVDEQPAAGIIVLFGQNAHYTRGAMDKVLAGPSRASFLLQKLAIEEACNRGCRYYNMGETGSSHNLARFKKHFGATEYRYPEYRFERLPVSKWETRIRANVKSLMARRTS
jgi:lipid II:glycine glycyltransferase (peptidoglycan interpeptide bridge formation enzyme)